ncbi:MAG: TIM-barrel domain-containing protein [Bacilli bacterium]
MYNKDYEEALKDYYNLTGYPALIPRFALGNWWSRNNDYDDIELKDLVDTFEKKEIPLSVVLLDKDWHKRKYDGKKHLKTGFTFNNEYFKNPSAMIGYLHSKGIRLGLNVNPLEGLTDVDVYYAEALKFLEPDKNGDIPFNAFDPKFIDVYLKLFIHPLDAVGVDFFWLDTFDESKMSELALLKHYQFYDMERDYKRRPMVLANDMMLAPHRYPVLYSGKTTVNWSTLRKLPFYNASAFNNGVIFWAHDIGGYFKGVEDGELYTRFVQLETFSPILKFGADKGKYYKREPWRWDIKTYTIVKDYLQLRHKLVPYIYSEAYKYHKFGKPLIKPIYFTKPDFYDDVLYRNEYYFGGELFVAPIVSQKDYVMNCVVHNFYIPDGMWYDFVTGKKFPGGRNYVAFFRDEEYPVFAKSGAIIPMGTNENINDTTPPDNMEIQIFPGQNNTYTLFEDDGQSDLYRKDFYLLTEIEYNYLPSNYSVIIRSVEGKSGIIPDKRNYKIVFRNTKRTDDVTVYSNRDKVSFKTYVDGPDFVVEVEGVKTVGQLTINCKGQDIEIDAVHLINRDIEGIISDLQITTEMKEKIDAVLFSDLTIQKKRIEIRKLGRQGLDKKFIKMFIKLLEYISEI